MNYAEMIVPSPEEIKNSLIQDFNLKNMPPTYSQPIEITKYSYDTKRNLKFDDSELVNLLFTSLKYIYGFFFKVLF